MNSSHNAEARFDRTIKDATFIEINEDMTVDSLFSTLAEIFSGKSQISAEIVYELFWKREKESSTSIHPGFAIPHIIVEGNGRFDIVVARSRPGIRFGENIPPVNIVFAIIETGDERHFHLQVLMAIAQIIRDKDFMQNWGNMKTTEDLRTLILNTRPERKGDVQGNSGQPR